MTDRFLSAASLNHRWQAQVDFASSTAEAMELAKRSFIGEDISTRSTAGRIKRRGDLRIWSVEEGWKFVKVAKSELVTEEGSSPFLPADLAVWAAEDD